MGNSATVTLPTGKDVNAAKMIASFTDGVSTSTTPGRYCQKVTLVSGEQPSYAFVSMPVNTLWDEQAPAVALRASGPAGRIKPNVRGSVGYSESGFYIPLLVGTLVQYAHDIGNDTSVGLVVDDRHWLSKITCTGRMCYDPVYGVHYFDHGIRLIFNEDGYPNCIDTDQGPRFAPSRRFGYRSRYDIEDSTEPEVGQARKRARSWTVADVAAYLRAAHTMENGNLRPPSKTDLGNVFIDPRIYWPDSIANVLGSNRTVKHFVLENISLLRALQMTARKAGAYDLYCHPIGQFSSKLMFVNMNPPKNGSGNLFLPDYFGINDVGTALLNGEIIHSGYVNESVINYFDDVCICGDPPAVEKMISQDSSGDGANMLEPGWTTADETAFKSYITNHPTPNQEAAFKQACEIWQDVYRDYRMKPGADIWNGTKWNGWHNGGAHPRFKPMLLTGDNNASDNPKFWMPRQIKVEYKSGSNWVFAGRFDGLTLTPDGQVIQLPGLRDTIGPDGYGETWRNSGPTLYNGATLEARTIRFAAVAVEADWRITGRAAGDPNRTSARVAKSGNKSTFLTVAEELDYVDDLRNKSHPAGSTDAGLQEVFDSFADKCIAGDELFSDRQDAATGRLPRHATARLADVKRIEYTGQVVIARLNPALRPGMAISIESADPIPTYSVIKSVTFEGDAPQVTIVELGAADSATIYDIPQPAPSTGNIPPPTQQETGKPPDTGPNKLPMPASNDWPTETWHGEGAPTRPPLRNGTAPDRMPAPETGGGQAPAPAKRGRITTGAEMEKQAEMDRTFGRPESGIYVGDSARDDVDTNKMRVAANKFAKTPEERAEYNAAIGPTRAETRSNQLTETQMRRQMAMKRARNASAGPDIKDE